MTNTTEQNCNKYGNGIFGCACAVGHCAVERERAGRATPVSPSQPELRSIEGTMRDFTPEDFGISDPLMVEAAKRYGAALMVLGDVPAKPQSDLHSAGTEFARLLSRYVQSRMDCNEALKNSLPDLITHITDWNSASVAAARQEGYEDGAKETGEMLREEHAAALAAAREQVLEEAALACEGEMTGDTAEGAAYWDGAAGKCAVTIRALKASPASVSASAPSPFRDNSVGAQVAGEPVALSIGVSVDSHGASVCVMQRHPEGNITALYSGTHSVGDSMGVFTLYTAPVPAPATVPHEAAATLAVSYEHTEGYSFDLVMTEHQRKKLQAMNGAMLYLAVAEPATKPEAVAPVVQDAHEAFAIFRTRPDENEGREFFYCAMHHGETALSEGERMVKGYFVAAPVAVAPVGLDKLHSAIMNLPCKPVGYVNCPTSHAQGHRDARHAAAELVAATQADLPVVVGEADERHTKCADRIKAIASQDVIDTDDKHRLLECALSVRMMGDSRYATQAERQPQAAAALAQAAPYGWLYGNSFWECSNPRTTDHIKQHGFPLFAAPAAIQQDQQAGKDGADHA